MKNLKLKYGCNPNQDNASIFMRNGGDLPIDILCGNPGYINFLDAFNAYQLVKEMREVFGIASAASFKHVSPTSAALGIKLSERQKKAFFVDDIQDLDSSPLACAYARARGTDRMSSFGDFIALSDTCDRTTAQIIRREVSDGIIAPDYDDDALEILKTKKGGRYNIIKIDKNYRPENVEQRDVFGITFTQSKNNVKIDKSCLRNIVTKNRNLPDEKARDLIVAMLVLKYTQSNSVCYAYDGQAIGVGAGQQSRIHCTRLAGDKCDTFLLRQSDKVLGLKFRKDIKRPTRDNVIDMYINKCEQDLFENDLWKEFLEEKPEVFTDEEKRDYISKIDGVCLASDAFFPFSDNIRRAYNSSVKYVVETGGSVNDDEVIRCLDELDMVCCFTGIRLFHH